MRKDARDVARNVRVFFAIFADTMFANVHDAHLFFANAARISFVTLLFFFVIFSPPLFAQNVASLPDDITFWSDYPSDVLARAIVERMTDEERFSQVFMFGWAGAEPEQLLYDWVDRGLGSVKVFGWNTDDIALVARAISNLQWSASRTRFQIPLFVATDQEGGWIRHVKGETSITPGNMAIGAAGFPADAWYSGFYISREIKALGINMNFAPSLDLFTNRESTIIGPRSFGDDPKKVGVLGAAFAAGSMAAGVIPTAKHFPGHGDTDSDSHIYLPEIDINEATFNERELAPFVYLVKQNIPAIMSGHLSFPQIDSSGAPASLSKYFLTDLLRGKLGFDGLIITDDMMMNGDTLYAGSLSSAIRMALEAGNDIVISSTTARLREPLWEQNLALLRTSQAFRARITDAAYRIIKAKLDYFKSGNAAPLYPNPDEISEFIPDKEGEAFFLSQACRSITAYKAGTMPLSNEAAGRVLLAGSLQRFFTEGRRRFPNADLFRFSTEAEQDEIPSARNSLATVARNYDTVVCLVSNWQSARIVRGLQGLGKRVVILSILSPDDALDFDWADSILMGYSWSRYTLDAMFGALAGEFEPRGVLPFVE